MNPKTAKEIIKKALKDNNLPDYKLSSKTVDFSDLARGGCIFVKIHNWVGCKEWDILKSIARDNHFCIEA
jgi:hypothetical protein